MSKREQAMIEIQMAVYWLWMIVVECVKHRKEIRYKIKIWGNEHVMVQRAMEHLWEEILNDTWTKAIQKIVKISKRRKWSDLKKLQAWLTVTTVCKGLRNMMLAD